MNIYNRYSRSIVFKIRGWK